MSVVHYPAAFSTVMCGASIDISVGFTFTRHPEAVTCKGCIEAMAQSVAAALVERCAECNQGVDTAVYSDIRSGIIVRLCEPCMNLLRTNYDAQWSLVTAELP